MQVRRTTVKLPEVQPMAPEGVKKYKKKKYGDQKWNPWFTPPAWWAEEERKLQQKP